MLDILVSRIEKGNTSQEFVLLCQRSLAALAIINQNPQQEQKMTCDEDGNQKSAQKTAEIDPRLTKIKDIVRVYLPEASAPEKIVPSAPELSDSEGDETSTKDAKWQSESSPETMNFSKTPPADEATKVLESDSKLLTEKSSDSEISSEPAAEAVRISDQSPEPLADTVSVSVQNSESLAETTHIPAIDLATVVSAEPEKTEENELEQLKAQLRKIQEEKAALEAENSTLKERLKSQDHVISELVCQIPKPHLSLLFQTKSKAKAKSEPKPELSRRNSMPDLNRK